MTKLLAALALPQVGAISVAPPNEEVPDGSMFTLELGDRIYTLKANDAGELHPSMSCDVWRCPFLQ